ncbi:MAG TPA: acetate/propionate family kinase [Candidatus Paceibacterota bacterium]|nr:acetate/propionate family kinase [Candidatus Paceibacterota bacterium]
MMNLIMKPDSYLLTINAGSSSIKFALFDADSLAPALDGSIERIGLPGATLRARDAGGTDDVTRPVVAATHAAAAALLMDFIDERGLQTALVAVGHRIVHGGPSYNAPVQITPDVITELRSLAPLDPEHAPEELLLAEAFQSRFPHLPQVACFDTAFHHDLPRTAQMLSIPRRYEAQGVRRYGFHGLSYAFLMEELGRVGGEGAVNGRVILAHLGSGASLAAVSAGKPVDTSMGFTPAGGIVMSTRSGDIDPGLVRYLMRTEKMTAEAFDRMVTLESGLLGISETTSDMYDLISRETEDVRAAEAVELFCYQVKKGIGAYAAALGGVDTLIFAGGIGENSSILRSRICSGLGFLGIELDEEQNAAHAAVISSESGRVAVRVMHTDEARMIAQSVREVLGLAEAKR